jgi:hypothetical protein
VNLDWSRLLDALASPELMLGLALTSIALVVGSAFGALWAVKRLPEDYLVRDEPLPSQTAGARFRRIAKNVVGFGLLIVGLLLLVLPGQGVLTLIAAVSLLDFPGKRALERRMMSRPRVLHAINRFREKVGRPPLRSA